VNNKRLLIVLCVSMLLASCSSNDTRYHDNANLERPPEMPKDKQAADQIVANEVEKPLRRSGKGLKSDVYMIDGPPIELRLKRGFDESWSLINRAIQLNELKVPDQDRSKGLYYVEFSGAGFFSNAFSILGSDSDKATYELKVEPQNDETRVTVNRVGRKEDSDNGSLKDGFTESTPENKASNLLTLIYDSLHDQVNADE
jgi:uncharacterized lipoprotein